MNPAPNIILVDDDPAIRSSLSFSLELEGFAVSAFASGPELLALEPLPQEGCLVLDYRLPGIDGLQLLGLLRRCGVALPAIIITSTPSRSLRARVAQAGAILVEKPLMCDALASAVRAALSESRAAA